MSQHSRRAAGDIQEFEFILRAMLNRASCRFPTTA